MNIRLHDKASRIMNLTVWPLLVTEVWLPASIGIPVMAGIFGFGLGCLVMASGEKPDIPPSRTIK